MSPLTIISGDRQTEPEHHQLNPGRAGPGERVPGRGEGEDLLQVLRRREGDHRQRGPRQLAGQVAVQNENDLKSDNKLQLIHIQKGGLQFYSRGIQNSD